ncbi:MAG: pesticidal protein Cry7Aa [Bacteroidota bacterium]
MVEVKKEGIILKCSDLDFENEGVLNPAVMQVGEKIHLFYRAVQKGNQSSIGYCRLNGPLTLEQKNDAPFLTPEFEYEQHGMEDPRIVQIDGLYYLSYVAFDGANALGALATSADLVNFERKGIIVPQISYADFDRLTKHKPPLNEKYLRYNRGANILADKDFVFFPRRINGKLTFLHRLKPDIQITSVDSLTELNNIFWEDYFLHFEDHIMLEPKYPHEVSYVGAGCPPIETKHGWLLIYHGVKDMVKGYEYSCCVALLDLDDPRKEISRLPYPLFKPELFYELKGDVDDVCFPTGTAQFGDTLYIYYGAADELIACASVSLPALLDELMSLAKD